jgi:hypothetical protein
MADVMIHNHEGMNGQQGIHGRAKSVAIATVQGNGTVKAVQGREQGLYLRAARQKPVQVGNLILAVEKNILAKGAQDVAHGNLRTEGIPVRVDMGCHQNVFSRIQGTNNLVTGMIHLLLLSP